MAWSLALAAEFVVRVLITYHRGANTAGHVGLTAIRRRGEAVAGGRRRRLRSGECAGGGLCCCRYGQHRRHRTLFRAHKALAGSIGKTCNLSLAATSGAVGGQRLTAQTGY